MTEEGHRACASDKELYLVEGAGHGRSFLFDPEGLTNALTDFFRRNCSNEFILEDNQ